MRKFLPILAAAAVLAGAPVAANAASGTVTGAAGGAVTGAIVGGPVGAAVGGVVGAVLGTAVDGRVVVGARLPYHVALSPLPPDAYFANDGNVYASAFYRGQHVIVDADTRVIVAINS